MRREAALREQKEAYTIDCEAEESEEDYPSSNNSNSVLQVYLMILMMMV